MIPSLESLEVAVSSPFALDSPQGNVVSAHRIARHLGARVVHGVPEGAVDVLIVLHARRSAATIRAARATSPEVKVVVVLTGTDLHRDVPAGDADALWSLETADRLATYHEAAVHDVPEPFRQKVVCGYKSIDIALPKTRPDREKGLLTVVQHLREVKAPFLTAHAAVGTGCEVVNIGRALQESEADEARWLMRKYPHFRWLGELPRAEVLGWQLRAMATVNSAAMEGGANAVLEAMVCATPVLASQITGNVGLLGADYPAYFDFDDREGLRRLICRVRESCDLRTELAERVMQRARLFTPERERDAWREIVGGLFQ